MRLPIRFKILVTQLLAITTILGVITFTMGKLFHADKSIYIRDMTSVMAQNAAVETHELLNGYRDRVQTFAQFSFQSALPRATKVALFKQLFEDSKDLLAITIFEKGEVQATVFDATLNKSDEGDRQAFEREVRRTLPDTRRLSDGKFVVVNSTLSSARPTLTMYLKPKLPNNDAVVMAAVINIARLQEVSFRSKVVDIFVMDTQGNLLIHSNNNAILGKTVVNWIPKNNSFENAEISATTVDYQYKGQAMIGGIARVDFGELLAVAQIPASTAYVGARELLSDLTLSALLLLLVASVGSIIWARYLTRPIEQLSAAAKVVGGGDFNVKVDYQSRDEIGDLANSFNGMTDELTARDEALKKAQAALVQSEKMSAFGQMSAGIAHEVKNPLAGILGYVQLARRKIETDHVIQRNLEIIESETKRCTKIISNLMQFARQEKTLHLPLDVNKVVTDSITIFDHQLSIQGVKVESDLQQGLPKILGDANQLQQILMNFAINAQQAMEGRNGSFFKLTTLLTPEDQVRVIAEDNGPGMSDEVREKIFEPFFTTKPAGRGTGLGLSVTYGIVNAHNAKIKCESQVGVGTRFILDFPVAAVGGMQSEENRVDNGKDLGDVSPLISAKAG
ncbi:MAG: ATP-binding protein [Gammaproteobacteria bacterium]|nr:ATP-binding protein [Gammaproteobacteria bacterium]